MISLANSNLPLDKNCVTPQHVIISRLLLVKVPSTVSLLIQVALNLKSYIQEAARQ